MTPETDAAERMAYAQEYMVPTEFARKLERERDEAREDATNYYAKIGELTQERDEAREALREIQSADWKTSGELRGMAREALKSK